MTAAPPCATVVLVEPGADEGGPGQQVGQAAQFVQGSSQGGVAVGRGATLLGVTLLLETALGVLRGGLFSGWAGAEVLAQEAAVDAACARVVAAPSASCFPGHGCVTFRCWRRGRDPAQRLLFTAGHTH